MRNYNFHQEKNIYNDYKLTQIAQNKYLSHHKSQSTGNIYFQSGFITNKNIININNNSQTNLPGQYMVNNQSLNTNNANKRINFPRRLSNYDQELKSNKSKQTDIKLKIKSIRTPSPLTATKVLNLKKSLIKQKCSEPSLISSEKKISIYKSGNLQRSIGKFKLENKQQPSIIGSITSPLHQSIYIEDLKRQLLQKFTNKINQFNKKISYQSQIIRSLQKKIQDNCKLIQIQDKSIQQLKQKLSETSNKKFNFSNLKTINQKTNQIQNQKYLINRLNDIEAKFKVFDANFVKQIELRQNSLNLKTQNVQNFILKIMSCKIQSIKNKLTNFVQDKSQNLIKLNYFLDLINNKLLGRSQMLKQTLVQIKFKLQSIQDNQTKESMKKEQYLNQIPVIVESNSKLTRNKLKKSTDQKGLIYKNQESLNHSLTQNQQISPRKIFIHKKMTQIDNIYQISDFQFSKSNNKNQISRLTDDFYHLKSSNSSFRNISPISNKIYQNQINQNFKRKNQKDLSLDINSLKNITAISKNSTQGTKNQQQENQNQKVNHKTITKKIQAIKSLIEEKKKSLQIDHSLIENSLRCFIDKTGYLKYSDSKTFVFDNKGNLIQCSEGQYWVMVTKGLIYGNQDYDHSSLQIHSME